MYTGVYAVTVLLEYHLIYGVSVLLEYIDLSFTIFYPLLYIVMSMFATSAGKFSTHEVLIDFLYNLSFVVAVEVTN